MRAWGLGATLLALVCAGFAMARAAEIPETHLLLLDRSALKPADPARDGPLFEAAEKLIYSDLMARHGANVILDTSAAPAHWSGLDVTREAETALHAAIPEWSPPPQAPTTVTPPAAATPVRMLVMDIAAVDSSDAKFQPTLEHVAAGQGATLVVDRKAVVIGAPGFDITALVRSSLETFRNAGTLPLVVGGPDVPFARIAILDRQAILRNSAVGNSIATQVRELVKIAKDEFGPESLSLKKEGEVLQAESAKLAPDERDREMTEFKQRRDVLAEKVKQRQDQIRAAVAAAQRRVEGVAGPIVQQMVKDGGANLVLDRMAVVAGDDTLDITASTIEKLNAALPRVDVVLAPAEK